MSISVSKIINKREEKFESRLLKSVLKVIHTHEEEFESHVLESVSKIIHTYDEEFESRVLSSVFIHTYDEAFESRVLESVSKIIQTHEKDFESRMHKHEEKSKSRVPAPDPIIISVPEKFRIAIKNLKDAGYPPREIKRIMKAKGKNVPANALRELLKDPIFPGDFSTSRRL
ncbi:unnamed protein product [marine sediment metagenome]|uniref:Uncharacterized protein n=1 Tax=marine sediment metagenome TaxID=412755 RepID=X1DEJ6_9ZZZZ